MHQQSEYKKVCTRRRSECSRGGEINVAAAKENTEESMGKKLLRLNCTELKATT
jgi:hypothetical protein